MDQLSWERNNLTTNSTSFNSKSSDYLSNKKSYHNPRSRKDKLSTAKLDLLAFGYSCKLFDNDEQAKYLDQGKSLVPWSGDNNLLIDRFDVRNYLNSNELKKYETKIDTNFDDQLTENEIEFEKKLDNERYRDLYDDDKIELNDKQNKQIDHDEELRKWKESIEEDNKKNNQFQFNYDNLESNYKYEDNQPVQKINNQNNLEDDKEFILPDNLNLPSDLKLPTTMREHNLIEKTAKFISKQNVQMEIILKTKQSSNSQFDFLNYDDPLNPYYKYLLKSIKEGTYKPKDDNSDNKNETDDESDEDNYLHPSLQSSKSTMKPQNTFNYNSNLSTNLKPSSYSKLAENLKDKIVINDKSYYEPKVIENKAIKYDLNKNDNSSKLTNSSSNKINNQLNLNQPKVKSVFELIPEVPDETKIIIEKLAQYVSKNGDEFEKTVKSRNEDRFDFLNPGHKFHFYYIQSKLKLLEEKRKKEKKIEPIINKSMNDDSIKPNNLDNIQNKNEFDSNQKITPFMISSKRQTFKDDLEAKLKEKQEERKRKAALFLSKLKSEKSNDDEQTEDDNKIFGPQLCSELQPQKNSESENFRNTPSPLKEFFDDIKEDKSSFNRTKFREKNSNSNNAIDNAFKRENSNDARRSNSIEQRIYRSSSKEIRHHRSSSKEIRHHSRSHHRSISKSRSRSRSFNKLYYKDRSRSRSISKIYRKSRSISRSISRSRSRSNSESHVRNRSRSRSISRLYRRSRSRGKSKKKRSRSRSRSHRKKSHKSYRSRSRSLSRHRRSRSKSLSRHRRSRSRSLSRNHRKRSHR